MYGLLNMEVFEFQHLLLTLHYVCDLGKFTYLTNFSPFYLIKWDQ